MVTPPGRGAPLRPTCPSSRGRNAPWRRWLTLVAAALLLVSASAACGGNGDGDDGGGSAAGCVEDPAPGEDLFPDKYDVRDADNLSLTYHDTYKVLRVAEPYPDGDEQVYVLAQCGTEPPPLDGDLAGATVVEIPVRSLFSQSTSHLGFVDALGVSDVVTGVSDEQYVVMPSVRERIGAGEVTSFAPGGVVDTERVIAEAPDVYVTAGTEDAAYDVLTEAGVPVVANAEWLETSPQGWSDWIGFFAALTNTEAQATEVHDRLVAGYERATRLAAEVDDRPTVITGGLNEGDWYARGGAGIVPRFIADAGGDYVYADDPSTGSLVLDIETVLADARDAEVWLSPLGDFSSRRDAIAADERYGTFAAWDEGGVWSNDEARRPDMNVFEVGPVMIDDYLLDYVKILHPDLVPDHELVFFRQLPNR